MRSRLAIVLGGAAVAGAAVYRFLRPGRAAEPVPDPRAEELRARLEESREVVSEREEFESAETTVDLVEPVSSDPGDRRRAIHERGRRVAEKMRRGGANPPE